MFIKTVELYLLANNIVMLVLKSFKLKLKHLKFFLEKKVLVFV